jgi:hypothetical protein
MITKLDLIRATVTGAGLAFLAAVVSAECDMECLWSRDSLDAFDSVFLYQALGFVRPLGHLRTRVGSLRGHRCGFVDGLE